MEIRKEKVAALSNDLSNLVLNKVLAKDINIHEALKASIGIVPYILAKSMPEERFDDEMNKTIAIMSTLTTELNKIIEERNLIGRPVNITEMLLAINNTLEYTIDNVK